MTRYCKQCGRTFFSYKPDPPEFCNFLCEERFKAEQELEDNVKDGAKEWTRNYLNSLTPN